MRTHGIIAAAIIAVAAVLLATLFKPGHQEMPKEYNEANQSLQNQLDGKLAADWFSVASLDSLLPRTSLFVDWTDTSIVVKNRDKKQLTRIHFNKKTTENSVVSVRPSDTGALHKIMKELFLLPDTVHKVETLANAMGGIAVEYVMDIANKKPKRENAFLSLLYNALLGDKEGHVAVGIENGKLHFVRFADLPHHALWVETFCRTVQNIDMNRIDPTNKTLLDLMIENRAVDTNYPLQVVYFNRRSDCVVSHHGVIASVVGDADRFTRLVGQIKRHPDQVMLYDANGDSLIVLDNSILCSDRLMIGTIDPTKANTLFKQPKASSWWLLWLLLGFVVGMLAAPGIYSYLRTRRRKKGKNKQSANIPQKQSQTALSDEYSQMGKEDLLKVLSKYVTVAKSLHEEKAQQAGTINRLKDENARLIEERTRLASNDEKQRDRIQKNDKIIDNQEKTIQQNAKEIKQLKNDLEDCQKQVNSMKPSAAWYNALVGCKDEADLLNRLDQMRENSKGKMARVYALSRLLPADAPTDIATLKSLVAKIDDATSRQFGPLLLDINAKSQWYDANYKQTSDEAAAYRLFVATRHTKPSSKEFRAATARLQLDTNDTKWMSQIYTGARMNSQSVAFSEMMWNLFVKEFVSREPLLNDPNSQADKSWYFTMLFNIAYHTADHIRALKSPNDTILCYNKLFMDENFNFDGHTAKPFDQGNINLSTAHSNLIAQWASELGVQHLKILVDQYAIMP